MWSKLSRWLDSMLKYWRILLLSIRFNGSIITISGNRLCNNWINHKISINFAKYNFIRDGKDFKGISEIN